MGSVAGPDGSGLAIRKYRQKDTHRADVEVVEKSGAKRRLKSFDCTLAEHAQGEPVAFVRAESWMDGYLAGRESVNVPPIRPQARMKAGKKKPT